MRRPDPDRFVRDHTRLLAVPSLPAIRLHMAHSATGLWRLARPNTDGTDPPPPYWAFPWAGGLALARYLLDRPETVRGRAVLDLGAGSGLVGIAAALAGARSVTAAETDAYGLAAIPLNAAANGVALAVIAEDILDATPPAVDIVVAGDLFYERLLARRVTGFLDRCLAAGITVLVGDPRRIHLPGERLTLLAEYAVPDVGDVEGAAPKPAAVFAFGPTPPGG